ncbi:DUF72 domain-containing protein [bacterium]|nr:DUF72 domain-containing protein [bacterium]
MPGARSGQVGARILCGCASWADRPLVDSGFYPTGVHDAESRLRHYASQFPLVEVDTSYYAIPDPATAAAWAARTPGGFTFDIKAFSLFTEHPAVVARLPKEVREALPAPLQGKRTVYRKDMPGEVVDRCWQAFVDAVYPLEAASRLGVVVFQFPKWVFPNRRTLRYLEELRQRLGRHRAAVEFRSDTWLKPENREETLSVLGDLDFSYICIDGPQGFRSSIPPIAVATNDTGFVRFHGRNTETWEKRTRTSAERFDYWYRPEELDEWVPRIRQLAEQTSEVHLVMNTNNHDQGPKNMQLLEERLEHAGVRVEDAHGTLR